MKKLIPLILLFTACTNPAYAEVATFAPPNELQVYDTADFETFGTTKRAFDQAIVLVQRAFEKEVAQKGYTLKINNMWSNPTVNAQAYRRGKYWYVDAFGGLARFGNMTIEGYVGVLCHEVGHHLGGRPRYTSGATWASVEGQSDYWAFRRCVERVVPGSGEYAALSMAGVLAKLGGERAPRTDTPDRRVVTQTYEAHPSAQCRLDTAMAALIGRARPLCWFKP